MDTHDRPFAVSWFRSRGGRRYGTEFAAIIIAKVVLLVLLWLIFIRPQPRVDTTPAAIEQHLLAPAGNSHDR